MSMRGGRGLFYIYSVTHSLVSIIYPHSIIYTHSLTRLLVSLTRRTQPMNIYGIYNLDNDVPSTLMIVSWKLGSRGFFAAAEFRWSIYNTKTNKRVIESRAQMYNVVCGQQTWQTRTEGRIDGLHHRQVILHSGRSARRVLGNPPPSLSLTGLRGC